MVEKLSLYNVVKSAGPLFFLTPQVLAGDNSWKSVLVVFAYSFKNVMHGQGYK